MSNALLEDITSRDRIRVWSSSCAIIKLREVDQLDHLASNLETIIDSVHDLSLGGILFPNSEHLSFAIRKLEFHRSRAGCLCALYPDYLMYNPEQEAGAGNVVIEGITYIKEKWVEAYHCSCTSCGQRYRVEEGEYHYTWWRWRRDPVAAADLPDADA